MAETPKTVEVLVVCKEPEHLREIVRSITYKPRWQFYIAGFMEDNQLKGWALYIISDSVDSYDHTKPMRVRHEFLIPPASYNRQTWIGWVFDRIRQVEDHEAGEFFMVDGVREFAPHHGNGEDPYRIYQLGTESQAKKKAGQD